MAGKRLWLGALALAAGVALTAACGGDGDKSASGSQSTGGSAGAVSSSGKTLSDCEYAKAVETAVGSFAENVVKATTSGFATSAPGSKDATNEQVAKVFDNLDAELGKTIADLKGLKLSNDLQKMNAGVISIFEDFRKQIPEMKKAALAGDTAKVTELITKVSTDLSPKMDKISKDNGNVTARLNKCSS